MSPPVDSVQSSPSLPSATDVVVIGGGIIGVSAAWWLARRGVSVVLCEKGVVAGEQSSRNWGWVRKQKRDPREFALIRESLEIWQRLDRDIEQDTGFTQCGIMYLIDSEDELARFEDWLEQARPYQFGSRLLSPREVEDLVPESGRKWLGGLYTATDGGAEPSKAAPAIARAVRRLGGTVMQNCAVRGLETSGGRVSGVVTEKGRIACSSVILAGGAWSGLFCRSLGIDLPQLKVVASVMRTTPLDGPTTSTYGGRFSYRRRQDGGYTVANGISVTADIVPDTFRHMRQFWPAFRMQRAGLRLRLGRRFWDELMQPGRWSLDSPSPFERVRVLDPEPDHDFLTTALSTLQQTFPVFSGARMAESWAGMIDATPDVVPVISPVSSLPGLIVATGFSGHGFGIGPGAGRLAAELATDADPVVDPSPFRLSRFSDGTPIEPYTGV